MGGRSNDKFKIDSDGNGLFSGDVSLENNGGFSSVHYQFEKINTTRDSNPLLITMTIVAQHPEVLLQAIGLFLFYVR